MDSISFEVSKHIPNTLQWWVGQYWVSKWVSWTLRPVAALLLSCLLSTSLLKPVQQQPWQGLLQPPGAPPMVSGNPWATGGWLLSVSHWLLDSQYRSLHPQEQQLDAVLGSTPWTTGLWHRWYDAKWLGVAVHGFFGYYHTCLHVKTCVCCWVHFVLGSGVEYESCSFSKFALH